MQTNLFDTLEDFAPQYAGQKVLIGLSGGINSAATLCYLKKFISERPKEIHLFYAHFSEHSDDTKEFVFDCVKYAFKHFAGQSLKDVTGNIISDCRKVHFTITNNSVNAFFKSQNMIPHPSISPCTRLLKIIPMAEYMAQNDIKIDLIGYVRTEKQRITKQQKRIKTKGLDMQKIYPISHFSNEDCFNLVKSEVGWYPKIYDYRWSNFGLKEWLLSGNINRIADGISPEGKRMIKKDGNNVKNQKAIVLKLLKTNKRIFAHNNCLMCKNWQSWEQIVGEYFFPEHIKKAHETAKVTGSHWGRDTDQLTFNQTSCTFCEF